MSNKKKSILIKYEYNVPGKDILNYYHMNYTGYYRNEVYTKDQTFYKILQKNDLLGHIPVREELCKDAQDDPIKYYKENYAESNEQELKELDPLFYKLLKNEENLYVFYTSKIGLDKDVRKKNRRKAEQNPIAYYKEHYDGMGSRELLKVDPTFYGILLQHDQLYILSSHHEHCSPMEKDPIGYYREKYLGLTLGELKKANHKLADILVRRGHKQVFIDAQEKKEEEMKLMKEDPVAYYKEHYPYVTSYQLRKKNRVLYDLLLYEGGENILQQADDDEKERKNIIKEDPVAYYRTYYKGMISSELSKKDPYLYYMLRATKNLNVLARKKKKRKK